MSQGRRMWAVRLLSVVAGAISAYLLFHSVSGERLPGCGLESGCGAVLASRWAYVLGLPVSALAVILYAVVLLVSFVPQSDRAGWRESFLLFSGTALVAAAIYFIGLQLVVIRAICPFCMGAHLCGLAVGALLLHQAGTSRAGLRAWPAVAGILCLGAVGTAQVAQQPKTFAVDSSAGLTSRTVSRVVELHDGSFKIDLGETPLLGQESASNVLVHLFDYTCPHCRRLHPMLRQLQQSLSNRVAIASLLVPLATNCNRLLKRPIQEHLTACEMAQAGLAVWRAKPEQLHAFEDWVFLPPRPPSPEAARAKGRELAGTNAFDRALADPWIKEHLARNITLYESNYVRFRKGVLPEVMAGTNIVSGAVNKVEDLYRLLGTGTP